MLKLDFWTFLGRKNCRRKEEIGKFPSIDMYKTAMMPEEHKVN
jgi:hypothetical protein